MQSINTRSIHSRQRLTNDGNDQVHYHKPRDDRKEDQRNPSKGILIHYFPGHFSKVIKCHDLKERQEGQVDSSIVIKLRVAVFVQVTKELGEHNTEDQKDYDEKEPNVR